MNYQLTNFKILNLIKFLLYLILLCFLKILLKVSSPSFLQESILFSQDSSESSSQSSLQLSSGPNSSLFSQDSSQNPQSFLRESILFSQDPSQNSQDSQFDNTFCDLFEFDLTNPIYGGSDQLFESIFSNQSSQQQEFSQPLLQPLLQQQSSQPLSQQQQPLQQQQQSSQQQSSQSSFSRYPRFSLQSTQKRRPFRSDYYKFLKKMKEVKRLIENIISQSDYCSKQTRSYFKKILNYLSEIMDKISKTKYKNYSEYKKNGQK